jgi:hypothetical protein
MACEISCITSGDLSYASSSADSAYATFPGYHCSPPDALLPVGDFALIASDTTTSSTSEDYVTATAYDASYADSVYATSAYNNSPTYPGLAYADNLPYAPSAYSYAVYPSAPYLPPQDRYINTTAENAYFIPSDSANRSSLPSCRAACPSPDGGTPTYGLCDPSPDSIYSFFV